MSFRRDNVIKVDVWVDDFVPDVDGHRRVQLWRAVAPAHVGDVVCLGDGELVLFADVEGIEGAHPTGLVLLKPLTDPDGRLAGPYRVDDGWCDHLDE